MRMELETKARWYFSLIWAVAIVLYLYHPIVTGKVLGDGGLFHVMTRALLRSWPREPLYVVYNGQSFPFAYPPLGFYLAASLTKSAKVPLLSLFEWLPAIFTLLHTIVFFLLSKEVFRRVDFAVGSTLFFVTNFSSYGWMIFGGGLTRSLGYLFALLSVFFVVRWIHTTNWRDLLAGGVSFGATLLSHSGTAFALFVALEFIFLYIGIRRGRVLWNMGQNMLLLTIAFIVAFPWWGVVIKRYGLFPLVSALGTGHKNWYSLALPQIPFWPHAPLYFYMLPFFVVVGALSTRPSRIGLFLAGGVVLTFILIPRTPLRYGAPLIAWLAQLGLERSTSSFSQKVRAFVIGWVALSLFSIAFLVTIRMDGISSADISLLHSLTRVAQHPPHRIIALPISKWWGGEFYNEWTPALTGFRVPLVVQGSEWTGDFFEKIRAHDNAVALFKSGLRGMCMFLYQEGIDLVWIHPDRDPALQYVFDVMGFKLVSYDPVGGAIYQVDVTKCQNVILGQRH